MLVIDLPQGHVSMTAYGKQTDRVVGDCRKSDELFNTEQGW